MKKSLLLMLLAAFAVTAGELPSVKDFGAKGDGKTDDTEALQKAADSVAKKVSRYGSGTLYFPKGRYRISKRITLSKIHLKGDSAVISQSDPKEDIFFYEYAWNTTVSGIEFSGGKNQLSFYNENTDKGMLTVRDCRFFNARGTALETRKGSASSLFSIQNCLFIKNEQTIISHCDWTSIRDIWITNNVNMRNKAVILNGHGVMTIDNLLGVPLCNGDRQRWIDNYGSLFVNHTRFGGEGGGFTPIYNFRRYTSLSHPNEVVVLRSWFAAASPGASCLVYCKELPNLIRLEDCAGNSLPVIVDPAIDLKNYFYAAPGAIKYYANNVGLKSSMLPELLRNPVIHRPKANRQISMEETLKLAEQAKEPEEAPVFAAVDLQRDRNLKWDLDECMDGSLLKNADYLYCFRRGDRMAVMRRVPGSKIGDWPHISIPGIKVDLKKYPVLVVEPVSSVPSEFAIKITVPEKKKLFAVTHRQIKLGRLEVDLLKEFPDLVNYPVFTLRFYYIPKSHLQPSKKLPHGLRRFAPAGSVIWFKTFGFMPRKGDQ